MKKSLIALAVLAASGTSFAQSTATISGSINVGVMATGAAGAPGDAAVATLGGGANAVNIVTSEDLGGGLKGGFNSQFRFNAATGDMNSAGTGNALFHAANAYLSGGFGTVAVGKIAEASNCAFDPWGCTGGAGVIAGATGTVSGLIAAGTQAQSISYTTPTISGFSASYQTTVSTRTNERSVLNLGYATGPLAVQFLQSKSSANVAGNNALAMDTTTPFIPKTALTAAPITDADGKGTSIGASYDLGVAKLAVFNAKTENATGVTTADITGLTATVPMGAITILAGYAKSKTGTGLTATAANDTKVALGMNYALSKRTTLGADLFKQDQVGGSTGFVTRVRHTF
jgi:predicted porin